MASIRRIRTNGRTCFRAADRVRGFFARGGLCSTSVKLSISRCARRLRSLVGSSSVSASNRSRAAVARSSRPFYRKALTSAASAGLSGRPAITKSTPWGSRIIPISTSVVLFDQLFGLRLFNHHPLCVSNPPGPEDFLVVFDQFRFRVEAQRAATSDRPTATNSSTTCESPNCHFCSVAESCSRSRETSDVARQITEISRFRQFKQGSQSISWFI